MSSKSDIHLLTGWIILLVCVFEAQAAFEQDWVGPRGLGMGGAGIALSGDGWGGMRNPAIIHGLGFRVASCWSQQFGLPELNQEFFSASRSFRFASFGIDGSTFGSDLYRETALDIGVARAMRPYLTVGASFGIRSLSVRNYGDGSAPSLSLGVLASPVAAVEIGVVWKHLNRARIEGFQERLPESLTIGASSRIGEFSRIVFDLISERHFPVETRFGIESSFTKHLDLRVGGRTEPFRPSCGIGIGLRGMRFHYAGDLHPDLGSSHSVGLEIQLD
ncbi:hypothetical protein KKC97_12720, partial [bacterium]|nr:hypothetical protein [bacterium]